MISTLEPPLDHVVQANGDVFYGGPRPECEVCGNVTTFRKPYCEDHIDQLPYVKELLERITCREAELSNPRKAPLHGLVAQEILATLSHGARTAKRLAIDLEVDAGKLERFLPTLVQAKLVQDMWVGSRRGTKRRVIMISETTPSPEAPRKEKQETTKVETPRRQEAAKTETGDSPVLSLVNDLEVAQEEHRRALQNLAFAKRDLKVLEENAASARVTLEKRGKDVEVAAEKVKKAIAALVNTEGDTVKFEDVTALRLAAVADKPPTKLTVPVLAKPAPPSKNGFSKNGSSKSPITAKSLSDLRARVAEFGHDPDTVPGKIIVHLMSLLYQEVRQSDLFKYIPKGKTTPASYVSSTVNKLKKGGWAIDVVSSSSRGDYPTSYILKKDSRAR